MGRIRIRGLNQNESMNKMNEAKTRHTFELFTMQCYN